MKKEYTWKLSDGREVTLEAEYTEVLRDQIVDADGFKVDTGEKEVYEEGNLVAYIDGKKFDSCWQPSFWKVIDTSKKGVKKIWGIKQIGFTAERAAEIEAFLKDVLKSGKTDEVRAYEAEQAAKERAERIHQIEKSLESANKNGIYTREEVARKRRNWNDTYNEGGEGFVPHFYSIDEVEALKEELAELKRQKGE